jgi:hypothetical protein
MTDIGLVLEFPDPNSAASFSSGVRKPEHQQSELQIVTAEQKQHMDGVTLILLIKGAGAIAGTLLAFLTLGKALLQGAPKPSVSIAFKDRRVELYGDATEDDLRRLADVLAGK